MAGLTISGPKALTLPLAMGGDDDIFGLVVVASTRGIAVLDAGLGQVEVPGITDIDLVTLDIVGLLVSRGAEVDNYPAYFELTEAELDDEVPESFPNRTYQDDDKTTVHTWGTWGRDGNSHAPQKRGDKWYKSSSDANNLGQPIPTSCWIVSGLTVLTLPEFLALQTSPESPSE